MFIEVINSHHRNYKEILQILVEHFGYNESSWYHERNLVKVYYKDIHVIDHLI